VTDVYISYAETDVEWARALAAGLAQYGVDSFFGECLLPGDILVHKAGEAMRQAGAGIALISPAVLESSWAKEEYAALAGESTAGRLRFVPVFIGEGAGLPPFMATRVWMDFRGTSPGDSGYSARIRELAAAIVGKRDPWPAEGTPGSLSDKIGSVFQSPAHPLSPPDQPTFVICYTGADQEYGLRLAEQVRQAGLPAWSVADLRPGDQQYWMVRQQLAYSIAVIVVMSPQSQDADEFTDMILQGLRHNRPFVPILLHGEQNYHLARYWCVDARNGQLPGPETIALLRRWHAAYQDGRSVDASRAPDAPPRGGAAGTLSRISAVRVPHAASLPLLDEYLKAGEVQPADLLTTEMLLSAAERLADGWMKHANGAQLPVSLLEEVDSLWARHTHGRQGLRVQHSLARAGPQADHKTFLRLSMAFGWQDSDRDVPGHYRDFAERAGPGCRDGFFPTLRNPSNEIYRDWYQQWWLTVLAVHARLRVWGG
jgi:hypothetical protein